MNKKIDKKQAIANLRREAQKRVVKDEVLKFRLEAKTLGRLLKLAKKADKPVGTLVRDWIVEKINHMERGPAEPPEIEAISIIASSLAERGLLENSQISQIHRLLGQER